MTSPNDDSFLSFLLSRNTSWSSEFSNSYPELLNTLSKGQHPQILWLGCSDSRCAETTLLGLLPGDVFVHRNIANIINPTDISMTSVVEFAVAVLKVQHVILCGHTSCGGVTAAMGNSAVGTGVIDTWLLPLRAVRRKYAGLLAEAEKEKEGKAKEVMTDLNVLEGLERLKENPIIMQGQKERGLKVWGLVYDVATARLREVETEKFLGKAKGDDGEKERAEAFATAK